ncbi:hypothetical protein F5887DRAFT_1196472 [Amanita rubescens]|nr:hypothetical protein F5887DRAFT_919295 [Amanita rubescens]KAF8345204.1 hypothetical protein F5887DRAFT_1196472 [Amanita rubescens]
MYYLIDSGVFERILIRQILGRGEVEDVAVGGAGTLQNPFTCTKINERALKSFLTLRKTAIYDQTPPFSSKEEWVDILKVSYFWQMEKMGEFAVRQLSKMQLGGIEKLKLAKQFGIWDKEWRPSAIRELIKRTNLRLAEDDVAEIGVNTALRIYKLQGVASQRLWLFPVTDVDIKKEFPELS